MNNMKPIIYRLTQSRRDELEEFGEFDLERFTDLVQSLTPFDELQQSVGLQASDRDWVDVSYNGNSEYTLYAPRLFDNRSLWKRLIFEKEISLNLKGIASVIEMANLYVTKDRLDFELKYS